MFMTVLTIVEIVLLVALAAFRIVGSFAPIPEVLEEALHSVMLLVFVGDFLVSFPYYSEKRRQMDQRRREEQQGPVQEVPPLDKTLKKQMLWSLVPGYNFWIILRCWLGMRRYYLTGMEKVSFFLIPVGALAMTAVFSVLQVHLLPQMDWLSVILYAYVWPTISALVMTEYQKLICIDF